MLKAENQLSVRNDFASFMVELVHQATLPYFHYRDEYPLDEEASSQISFFSYAAFDSAYGIQPSLQEAGELTENNPEAELQDLDYWVKKWKGKGQQEIVLLLCERINAILARKTFEKSKRETATLPDLKSRRKTILSAMRGETHLVLERGRPAQISLF